jgi:N-methylhydantoinase A
MFIGVDTGGTFTDFVFHEGDRVETYKIPSTPDDFSRAVLEGLKHLAGSPSKAGHTLIHSSTVATNAVLERKGAQTALITTKGFRDVLEIGRQTRPELYNLHFERPAPLVPRKFRREVTERVSSDGTVLIPLNRAELKRIAADLKKNRIESVAVCLLFSFLYPGHEKTVRRFCEELGLPVSLSSEVLPEFREYERTSTTVLDAFVRPVVRGYLEGLDRSVRKTGVRRTRIVQSNGGSVSLRSAKERVVTTILSGPSAGVIGAMSVSRVSPLLLSTTKNGKLRLITFDMGGTSTDVSLVEGSYRLTTESKIGGYPVGVHVMDIHTVGAGGGSLITLDAGGALRVGPESAGAVPGPACYGVGGQPTVTDANLVLGRIDPGRFLGGRFPLDRNRAERSLKVPANRLDMDIHTFSRAAIRIVNSNMERAIRSISVERGYDPKEFCLVAFGGAGGLHACELADALRIPKVLIPVNPGVLSAWGALSGDVVKDFSRTVMNPFAGSEHKLRMEFGRLDRQAMADLNREGFTKNQIVISRFLDLRYVGQSYEISVPYNGNVKSTGKLFHVEHFRRFGHSSPDEPMEIVTVRVRGIGISEKPSLKPVPKGTADSRRARIGVHRGAAVFDRAKLRAGNEVDGTALILEDYATTYIPEGWGGTVDRYGNLVLWPKRKN